jgi:6-pyruvoyltetrahydropterin/6-carboxytetrahydropterin synthase
MARAHFELSVIAHFSAAHHLRGYPGDCANPHGHNWTVRVHLACQELNSIGIGFDFREAKGLVKAVLEELDHSDLNTLPPFQEQNPSSEALAQYIYRDLARRMRGSAVRVARVSLEETPSYGVVYWEDEQ